MAVGAVLVEGRFTLSSLSRGAAATITIETKLHHAGRRELAQARGHAAWASARTGYPTTAVLCVACGDSRPKQYAGGWVMGPRHLARFLRRQKGHAAIDSTIAIGSAAAGGSVDAVSSSIGLRITLDDRPAPSETRFTSAGAWVLTIASTLPGPDGPVVELHSTYVGHPGLRTRATHLQIGPHSRSAALLSAEHSDDRHIEDCLVLFRPRELAYDQAHRLLELLLQLDHQAALTVPDDAFAELERPPAP